MDSGIVEQTSSTTQEQSKQQRKSGKSKKIKFCNVQVDNNCNSRDKVTNVGYIFRPNEKEKEAKLFNLRYSPEDDSYYQLGCNTACVKGWRNGTNATVNVTRRMGRRNDINLQWAYITRYPGRITGSLSWRFDFSEAGLVVDDITAVTFGRTAPGGFLRYDFMNPDASMEEQKQGDTSLSGVQSLLLVAYLDGDWGNQSQTQFLYHEWRVNSEDQNSNTAKPYNDDASPFEITIKLKNPTMTNDKGSMN